MIASLSIPWGETKGDEDVGGYHLVWTRDMVNSATGLLAIGNTDLPLRALIYLACAQRPDGGFYQNFWIDGEPYWRGAQLDEVAFPILLAWRLREVNALQEFDPYGLVLNAARYLIREGPATPQDRWEENGGLSPSTLAVHIAALICAASFAADRGDPVTAELFQGYADFLECHLERWTVTRTGTLVPGIPGHYIRIAPIKAGERQPTVDPERSWLSISNQSPGERTEFPAREIVDGGFLELVRYGIRPARDPLIVDSLKVIDAVLKVDTPLGPCWHRYNHDGYGEREDGAPYNGWGKGRAWPLLTGERGHYEVAAGRNPETLIETMERFAGATGLLPEQVWDEPDRARAHLHFGRPTGAALPLMWAHAEYLKLLRSARDGAVFDRIPEVAARYRSRTRHVKRLVELWKFNWQTPTVPPGWTLRIQADDPFILRFTADEWLTAQDTPSTPTAVGVEFVNVPISPEQAAPVRFTFLWTRTGSWQGEDFTVEILRGPSGSDQKEVP
jgi:glucoamylase